MTTPYHPKQLHLQDGDDDKLDFIVTSETGALIAYDGPASKSLTIQAAAFKFKAQDLDVDLMDKFDSVEQTVNDNLGSNNDTLDELDKSSI